MSVQADRISLSQKTVEPVEANSALTFFSAMAGLGAIGALYVFWMSNKQQKVETSIDQEFF